MTFSSDLNRRIDDYIKAVEANLTHKSPSVRRELLAGLRDHLAEALRHRANGGDPSPADIDTVFAEMDPPESFADRSGDGSIVPPPADPPPRRGFNGWLLVALASLAVNAGLLWKAGCGPCKTTVRATEAGAVAVAKFEPGDKAVVKGLASLRWTFSRPMNTNLTAGIEPAVRGAFVWTTDRTLTFTPENAWPLCQMFRAALDGKLDGAKGERLDGPREFSVQTEPLKFVSAEVLGIDGSRQATVQLVFNAPPDVSQIRKYVKMSEEGDDDLGYEVTGHTASNTVYVRTEEISHDKFDIAVEPGLPARRAPLGLLEGAKKTLPVVTTFLFTDLSTASPSFEACRLRIKFTAKVDPNGAAAFVEVQPAVKFTAQPLESWEGGGLDLVGDFQPGAVYTVKIKAGLKSEAGVALDADVVRCVQFENRGPSLSLAASGRYLSPRGKLLVPVSVMNIDEYTASLSPVLPQNIVFFAMRDANKSEGYYESGSAAAANSLSGRSITQTNKVTIRHNVATKDYIALRSLAGEQPHGVYKLDVGAREGDENCRDSQIVVVTDLGLSARVMKGGVLVWVASLRDAKPVSGAEVVLYAENNRELTRGVSDANGLVFLSRKDDDEDPFVVTAKTATDLSYLDLARTKVEMTGDLGERAYLTDNCEAYVFTERGVYRPGETAHIKALVRDAKLDAPKPFPALFRVVKPDGRVFKDIPVTLDAMGAAETAVQLPDYLPTGRYSFELVLPGTFLSLGEAVASLEDFVPPQIRVNLKSPEGRLAAGEAVGFSAKAEHLFGRAAAGLKASAGLSFKAVPFAPKAWAGWKFGDEDRPFTTIYRNLGEQVLDGDGAAEFSDESSSAWRPPAAMLAVQQVTVHEANGRTVTAYGSTPIDVYPFYIGVKGPSEGSVRVGETQRVSVVEVAPDGAAMKDGVPLQAKLARIQWNSVLKRMSSGRYEWKSERIVTPVREDILTAGGKPADFAFVADASGEYQLTLSDPKSGASTCMKFYAGAGDQQWIEWSREKPDKVELTLDRERYKPGDKARLVIKAPFAGTALLTVESDHVLKQQIVTLEKNTAEVAIDVLPEYPANVYCSVSLIRPAVAESVWSAHRAAGTVSLAIDPPGRALKVALDVPGTNRPQAKMTARITVKDENGAPVQGDAVVMAVDEAICMLTAFKTPDPLAWYLEQRRMSVDLFDLYSELMPVIDDAAAAASHTGGDGDSALMRRLNPIKASRFKPVALWTTGVHLDANGQADAVFDVPEFSGEMRVMAVVYNAKQTGSADQHVKVRRDLVVQPSLPRFLAPGDTCEATIDLFNESGKTLPVTAHISTVGPLSASKPGEQLSLAAGASKTLRLPIKAGAAPGVASCTFEVGGGSEAYHETIEMPVRPAAGLAVAADAGTVKPGETKALAAPAGWMPSTVAQDVWCSSQPDLALGRALDYVMHYPYGCLEQTVSGSFPLLYVADLANRSLPNSMAKQDVTPFVNAGILRVLSMQQGDGSFNLWPGCYAEGRYSFYATHFLVEAQKAGFSVSQDRLDAALRWLRERCLDRGVVADASPENTAWTYDMERRAYACHVLALAGKPDHGWNARLREEAARLNYAGRVHTACALMLSGEPRQATDILSRLGMPSERARSIDGLDSSVRDAALLLSAWLDIDPKRAEVDRLVQYLDKARRRDAGHWGTTQDDALSLLALGKYAQRVPRDRRPFTGALSLPDGNGKAFSSTQEVHWAAAPGKAGRVKIVNDGPGTLYYSLRMQGVPDAEDVKEVDNGFAIRRSWFNGEGAQIDPKSVEQGDLVITRIALNTGGRRLDNIAIEELLPAGWEIENPNLMTSQKPQWIEEKQESDPAVHRDIRDDRLILFTGQIQGEVVFYYAARAVSPGRYVYPACTASCMYDPEIRSVNGWMTVEVK